MIINVEYYHSKLRQTPFNEILVKFTFIVGMIADQTFIKCVLLFFYPTASATAYGQRPKFVRAEHSATAEGENCAYGPTLFRIEQFP